MKNPVEDNFPGIPGFRPPIYGQVENWEFPENPESSENEYFRSPIYGQVGNREFLEKTGIPGIVNNEYL